jgi:hypothetical protein
MVVDGSDGSMNDLTPNPLSVTLVQASAPADPAPAADPSAAGASPSTKP